MINRAINKVRAFFGSYFWLPCPICEKNFGGHEKGGGMLYDSRNCSSGRMTCPRCPDTYFVNEQGKLEKWTANTRHAQR